MAAVSYFVLRTIFIYLTLFKGLSSDFPHKIKSKQVFYTCESTNCYINESQQIYFQFCFFNCRYNYVKIQSNLGLKIPVCKSTKHGVLTLALPHSLFWMDLTVCMDVHSNPGPERTLQLSKSELHVRDGQHCQQHDLSSVLASRKPLICYSRKQILDVRSKFFLPSDLFLHLKDVGILKSRGVRSGKSVKSKSSSITHKIPTVIIYRPTNLSKSVIKYRRDSKNLIPITCSPSQLPSQSPGLLSFCVFNARSINNKTLEIKDYVVERNIDIFALTETWLKSDENCDFTTRDICPSGYLLSHIPRKDRIGGGIGILYRNNLKMELLTSKSFKSFEIMEMLLRTSSSVTHFVIIYRPPPSASNGLTNTLFFDEFTSFMELTISSPGKLVIAGDLNFHVDDKSDPSALKFIDILNCFNLIFQSAMIPTHRNNHVLDLIITRSDESTVTNFFVHDPVISDHYAVHCNLSINKLPITSHVISYRKLCSIDKEAFHRDINNYVLCQESSSSNLTDLCHQYDSVLSGILNKHAPLRNKTVIQRPRAPWYNDDIREHKTKRRKFERRWRRSGLNCDHQIYKNQSILVKKLIFETKMNYYSNLIVNAGPDSYSIFRSINRLLHRTPEKHLPSCSSSTALANKFVNFFKDKIVSIRSKLQLHVPTNLDQFDSLDTSTLNCQLDSFSNTSVDELSKIAYKLASKSCSLDPLPACLLTDQFHTLLPVICRIVNISLETGFVPSSLKLAVLSPLLKKSSLNHEGLGNYRPISNLKVVSKIIEKIVSVRLNDYLESNCLNEPFQSAYKRFHSCETALVRVQNDILNSVDNRRCVALLLLDLSAAFDTVDHNILLNRLQSKFGICGNALKWLNSYLFDRTQFVSINGKSSETLELKCGVPQGSVLGPILYLLYTSPVAEILRRHNMQFHLYADDTQLYISFSTEDEHNIKRILMKIENCLNDIDSWMSLNKLKLNKDKTELLFFFSKHRPLHSLPSLNFATDVIKPSSSARNIGVIFDSTLSMLPHINSVVKSAFYHLRNIARIRKFLSVSTTETLIHAFVTSKIDNCNSILYGLPKHLIKKLQSVQNAAARLITLSRKHDHITPILIGLHWLPVTERIKFKILLLTYKSLHNQAPSYIADLICRYTPSRNLRSSCEILLRRPNFNLKSYGHRSFSVAAPELWNSLPSTIRSSPSLQTFKSNLKTYLFKSAFYN